MDHAKFSFPLRPLTNNVTAVGVLLLCLCIAPATGQEEADTQLPDALQSFLESVNSFSARFIQELWSDDQQLIEVAEGDVELQRPGRFRWHYDAPWEQLIVADGETLWMYDIDISQVTRSPLQVNDPGNPGALLSGDSTILESFEVTGSGAQDDIRWITLKPRVAQSDYASVRVEFIGSGADQALSALEFVDGLSQTTVIRFFDPVNNPEIDAERFEFDVPDDVHVLGSAG